MRQVVALLFALTGVAQVGGAANDTNYAGSTLLVHTLLEPPFMMMDPTRHQFSGILYDVLNEVGIRTNITFQFALQAEGRYGYETSPGEWNGLIGDVHKGKCDLAVAPLRITSNRHEVVDFTQPLVSDGLRILYLKPTPWASREPFGLILTPFSPGLWTVIVLMVFAVTTLFYIIGRFSPYEDAAFAGRAATYEGLTVGNSLLYTYSSLTWQGYTAAPKSSSGRTLAACWWLFSLLVVTSFTANLAALFLTQEPATLSSPFLTFEELSMQTKVKYGCLQSGATMRYFNTSQRGVQKRMWAAMQASNPSVFVQSVSEGVQRVRDSNGDYAFIMEGPMAEHLANSEPCDLVVLGEQLGDHSYGAVCDKLRHPELCALLSVHILKLHEEDFIYGLREKYTGNSCKRSTPGSVKEIFFRGLQLFDSFGKADSAIRQEKAVTLHRFGAPLLLLGLGLVLSVALLLGEILYAKKRGHVKQPYSISLPDQDRIHTPDDAR